MLRPRKPQYPQGLQVCLTVVSFVKRADVSDNMHLIPPDSDHMQVFFLSFFYLFLQEALAAVCRMRGRKMRRPEKRQTPDFPN